MRLALLRGLGGCLLLAVLLGHAAGCGRPVGSVSGKVYYESGNANAEKAALPGGRVVFFNAEKTNSLGIAEIAADGSYSLRVPAGPVVITVETASLAARARAPKNLPTDLPPGVKLPKGYESKGEDLAQRYRWIPDGYADPQKSGLTYTVKPGSQEYDITLKGP